MVVGTAVAVRWGGAGGGGWPGRKIVAEGIAGAAVIGLVGTAVEARMGVVVAIREGGTAKVDVAIT